MEDLERTLSEKSDLEIHNMLYESLDIAVFTLTNFISEKVFESSSIEDIKEKYTLFLKDGIPERFLRIEMTTTWDFGGKKFRITKDFSFK